MYNSYYPLTADSNLYISNRAQWSDGTTSALGFTLWIDPELERLERQTEEFASAAEKRLVQLLEWTRRALMFWRAEHRRPVQDLRLPITSHRGRSCSLGGSWRVRSPSSCC